MYFGRESVPNLSDEILPKAGTTNDCSENFRMPPFDYILSILKLHDGEYSDNESTWFG
jgi:hypothetical protein